jgi:hypothetical protein
MPATERRRLPVSDPIIAPVTKAEPVQLAFDDEDGPLPKAKGDYIEGPQEEDFNG